MYPEGPSPRLNSDEGAHCVPELVSNNGSVKAGLTQDQRTSSENCDPNLRISRNGRQKCEIPFSVKETCISLQKTTLLPPSPQLNNESGGASPNQEILLSTRHGHASSKSSPTKSSSSPDEKHVGHDHRVHFCRSPRCASNNPDYAVPGQATPRKYLVSKRHLVPGAICSRDPPAVVELNHDSPVTSKPPKPIRKVEYAAAHYSHLTSNGPTSNDSLPPSRIPKPPGWRSPRPDGRMVENGESKSDNASEVTRPTCSLSGLKESSDPEERREDSAADAQQAASPVHLKHTSNLLRVESDMSCSVLVGSAASSQVSNGSGNEGNLCQPSDDSDHSESTVHTDVDDQGEICDLEQQLHPLQSVDSTPSSALDLGLEDIKKFHGSPSTEAEVEEVAVRLVHDLVVDDRICDEAQVKECKNPPEDDRECCACVAVQVEDCDSADPLSHNLIMSEVEESRPRATRGNLESADSPSDVRSADVDGERSTGNILSEDEDKDRGEPTLHSLAELQLRDPAVNCAAALSEHSEDCGATPLCQEEANETIEPQVYSQGHSDDEEDSRDAEEISQGSADSGEVLADFMDDQKQGSESQHRTSKLVRGKGRQFWRSDCRDSREVVFLKPTSPQSRKKGDWTVDSVLEEAISKLNPCGEGRVRVLVEAFESLLALGATDMPEKRASRVWCLNKMRKGEVDEDGEEFEEGDQRVDCYEVAQDGLHLRASMRLSLGGTSRLPLCEVDETSEIEMSAMRKVEEWADDSREDVFEINIEDPFETYTESRSSLGETSVAHRDGLSDDQSVATEMYRISNHPDIRRPAHFSESCDDGLSAADRFSENGSAHLHLKGGKLAPDCEGFFKHSRHRRAWRGTSAKCRSIASIPSSSGTYLKERRPLRCTSLEPFHLVTEERGALKEDQFARKLQDMLSEEERLRIPIAQGLPWTTDEPEVVPKPLPKDQTEPVDFKHYSNSRAIERAEFDDYLSRRSAYAEMQRQEKERLRQLAEEEEIKKLRREMVPRAQLMPFFDNPFIPIRSSKRLTVPKEPAFHNREKKRAKCVLWQDRQRA